MVEVIENATDAQFVLRLAVPPSAVDALSADVRAAETHAHRCQSTGFDTSDHRLAAHGVTFTLRRREREWVQSAVATTSDCVRLLVHEVDLGTRRPGVVPPLAPQLHDGTEAGAALKAALGDATPDDDTPLFVASFVTDATRLARTLVRDDATIELALVTGSIAAGSASASLLALELRHVAGPLAPLFSLADEWSARHGLTLGVASEGDLGMRLAAGHRGGYPTPASAAAGPFIDGADFLRATLDSCLTQVLANAGVIVDAAPERHVIDQLRHGLERMRTAIAALAPLARDMDEAWVPVLERTFHELATHRGTTGLRAPLIQEMRGAGLAWALATLHPRETRLPAAIVQDAALQRTLMAILAYRHALAPPFAQGRGSLRQLRRRWADALTRHHARVEDQARGLRSSAACRRAGRRLAQLVRLATFAGPLYRGHRVARFLGRCHLAEDAFAIDGEHRAGLEALEDDGEDGADVKLARRWLAARLRVDRQDCRTALQRVGKATAFWPA